MNLASMLGLEGVGALRYAPIQVIGLVHCQVVWADRCHCQSSNTAHTTCELNTLAIVILNLKLVDHAWFSHDVLVPCRYAAIASQWLRMAHVLLTSDMLLGGLCGLASTATTALLREERVGDCSWDFAAHISYLLSNVKCQVNFVTYLCALFN